MMRPKGEDIATAVRDWLKDEIKNASSIRHDLGKFYFGVTTGTIGLLISLKKFGGSGKLDWPFGFSLAILFLAVILALLMTIPKFWKIGGKTELYQKYNEHVKRIAVFIGCWFILWLAGAFAGVFSVLDK